ncbi:MAG: PspA/IM30 family protein [Gracilimonas sp.]|uniref:PspA/IM30 family protein n=1 Tax=Gracilimonas sediminicola TaxID=2952158 RepID=A0A9X2REH1_9BACT|nr:MULTISPECIES: PspA/IM30 family protein [Gracilimonas]MBO6586917.1 PspA/IM30 family protein [Gracilimonas sp.]MBO6614595.1 PspA/IM30 family protein [Gracilimonas sp.]MCP9291955.1 PspA/IM30 family protein [Gracilimonas sediminicola]
MFQRFIRAIKSMFGGLISSMEDPKLILEQNIRDLNDQIPQMNENIATVKANLLMLQKEMNRNEKAIQDLTAKVKSAIQADRDDIAEGYALQLEKAKENYAHTKDQLAFAEKAYEKAIKVKKVFMREKDRKIQEAKEALRASERSEWQAKIADTLEQFEVGGIDATHDEMINRINEQSAKNEARMEIALDSIDTETMEIEANAEKLRAKSLVEQFKMEMGEKSGSINIDEEEPAKEKDSSKTVGNKEKSSS